MIKVVWRFNLAEGVDEATFFAWLRKHVWASSARYGCATYAYRLQGGAHRYATEALWPSDEARQAWAGSDDFRAIPNYPGMESRWGAQTDLEATISEPFFDAPVAAAVPGAEEGANAGPDAAAPGAASASPYAGLPWGDLVRFQTSGPAGNDGLDGLPLEEKLLDLAAFFSKDAGVFAARAQQYFHQMRNRPWGGKMEPDQLLHEMRRTLAWFLGHIIGAGHHLEADVLDEFAAWSAEIGMHLPQVPHVRHPLLDGEQEDIG